MDIFIDFTQNLKYDGRKVNNFVQFRWRDSVEYPESRFKIRF